MQNYYFSKIFGQKQIYSAGTLEVYQIINNNYLKSTVLHYIIQTFNETKTKDVTS